MHKSTKIIATVVAIVLVVTAMLIGIYAATAGSAGINAVVSWTAQAGVDLEFWAMATGGNKSNSIEVQTITPTTTNTDANILCDLSCDFIDNTNDGVNNPEAISFKYYVKNKSLTPLKIKVTKTPAAADEAGTDNTDHTPKVVLSSQLEGTTSSILSSAMGDGYDLQTGSIFEYVVTLSMATGGTGTINADTSLKQKFDAGVIFNFSVGGTANSTLQTSVDGSTPSSVASSTVAGQTLGEYLSGIQTAEYSSGWFYDENLTKAVTEEDMNSSLQASSQASLYCKTASTDNLTFTLNEDNNSYSVKFQATSSQGIQSKAQTVGANQDEIVIPNMYEGKVVTGLVDNAFAGNTTLKNIVLPNGIKTIGANAFFGCNGLTDVKIPDSVETIKSNAFFYCTKLTSVLLPYGLKTIGAYAFGGCTSMQRIFIPASVTTITVPSAKNSPFSGCSETLKLYCEIGEKPEAWSSFWNYNSATSTLTAIWGVTRAEFNAL